jgi:hypothetical protein
MSSAQLEDEAKKYNDACNNGNSAGISQGSSNMNDIIEQNIYLTQNPVQETNNGGQTGTVEQK